jgi:iron complex outermembrane receptor protein
MTTQRYATPSRVVFRLSFMHRTVNVPRNAGGAIATTAGVSRLQKRRIRAQRNHVDDLLYRLELNADFETGPLQLHILAGTRANKGDGHTKRSTADVPDIADLFQPVIFDDPATLNFQCSSAHSCNDTEISGPFYNLYAIDHIDVTDWLKPGASLKGDRFDTEGAAT